MRRRRNCTNCTDASVIAEAEFCERAAWIAEQPEGQEPWTVEACEGWLLHDFAEDLQAAKLRRQGRLQKKGDVDAIAAKMAAEVLAGFDEKLERHADAIRRATKSATSERKWSEPAFRQQVEGMLASAAPRAAWAALHYRGTARFYTERDVGRQYMMDTMLRLGGIPDIVVAFGKFFFPMEVTSKIREDSRVREGKSKVREGKIWQNAVYRLVLDQRGRQVADQLGLPDCVPANWHKIATYREAGLDKDSGDESTYWFETDVASLRKVAGELYAAAERGEAPDVRGTIREHGIKVDEAVIGILEFNVRKQAPGWLPSRGKHYSESKCARCYRAAACERLDRAGR